MSLTLNIKSTNVIFMTVGRAPEKKASETLCAPNLVQSMISNPNNSTSSNIPSSNNATSSSTEKPRKVSLPPPVQFRDPPKSSDHQAVVTNGHHLLGSSDANRLRREKLERKVSNNSSAKIIHAEVSEPAVYESPADRNSNRDHSRNRTRHDPCDEDSGTIPLRRKGKTIAEENTSSLSRLETKRGQHHSPAVYVSPTSQREINDKSKR